MPPSSHRSVATLRGPPLDIKYIRIIMAATAPLLSKSAKLLASTRLARLAIAIFAVRSFAEGSRRRHGVDDDKRDGDDRDVDRGRRGPPRHPAARSASSSGDGLDGRFSPDFDHRDDHDAVVGGPTDDDGDRESKSFFERNGLEPPPLVSRADRPGRALEAKTDDDGDDENGISDVELITEEAKNGADAAARVRRDLIRPGRYDKHAYPWEYAWRGRSPGERTGVPVEFSINFHRVFGVDIINPVLDVIAWMRMEWVNPRLTWRPEDYGNLTKTWFWIGEGGAGGETSEIWTPGESSCSCLFCRLRALFLLRTIDVDGRVFPLDYSLLPRRLGRSMSRSRAIFGGVSPNARSYNSDIEIWTPGARFGTRT